MGSLVNQKGGFYKTIEITRDSSNTSVTTLKEPMLKNTENYVAQVQSFVTNITPDIFTFSDPLFTVKRKPDPGDFAGGETNYDDIGRGDDEPFQPVNCKTTTELARQLHNFCSSQDGLDVTLNMDFTIVFRMTEDYGFDSYLELSDTFSNLCGLEKYIHYFFTGAAVRSDSVFMNQEQFTAAYGAPPPAFQENYWFIEPVDPVGDQDDREYISDYSLSNLDTRISMDVTMTVPHPSIPEIVDGKEARVKVLARFPLKDFQDTFVEASGDYGTYTMRETINLGIEDMTRGNPDTHSTLFLPGEFHHANVVVETRYMENKQFKRVPTDFGTHGFWSLKLLLAKKVK